MKRIGLSSVTAMACAFLVAGCQVNERPDISDPAEIGFLQTFQAVCVENEARRADSIEAARSLGFTKAADIQNAVVYVDQNKAMTVLLSNLEFPGSSGRLCYVVAGGVTPARQKSLQAAAANRAFGDSPTAPELSVTGLPVVVSERGVERHVVWSDTGMDPNVRIPLMSLAYEVSRLLQ